MKAKEIQIGDWVRLQYYHYITQEIVTKDFQVTGIHNDFETHYIWSESGNMSSVEHIQPIPLTAEILEHNGFEEKTEINPFVYYLFKDGDNSVSLEHTYDTTDKEDYWACSIGNRLCDVCTISMHYIHELQHALRLCGITHEIVL